MQIAIRNYNGLLDGFIEFVKTKDQYTENFYKADCLVTWQDVRGPEKELVEFFKKRLEKPVVVVEHGRGATRDYCEPNKFPFISDLLCVWGPSSVRRLSKVGFPMDRAVVTGSPLMTRILPRNTKREGINVLMCPVISTKEEPENIILYAKMKEWESQKLINNIYDNYEAMKKAWAFQDEQYKEVVLPDGKVEKRLWSNDIVPTLPRYITYGKGFVHVKNTDLHDSNQYLAPVIKSSQKEIGVVFELLQNIDLVVCMDESTLPLIATAMGIPVVVCDIFKWGDYGGCKDYDRIEKIHSPAAFYCDLNKLPKTMDKALSSVKERQNAMILTVNDEMGGDKALKFNENLYVELTKIVQTPKN